MTFSGEPSNDDLTFETERLIIRPIRPDDSTEAYALLTHQELKFMDPRFVPPDAEAYAAFAQRMQEREENCETHRLYQWALRLKSTGELVGLISAELNLENRLQASGPPLEVRELETTAYIHPDHQHVGFATEADATLSVFVESRFEVNRRIAKIRHDNTEVQSKASASGAKKLSGQTPQGYETWILYDTVES